MPEWIVENVVKAESNDHKQSTVVWPYEDLREENVQKGHCHTKEKEEREGERESLHLLDKVGRGPRKITRKRKPPPVREVERGKRG